MFVYLLRLNIESGEAPAQFLVIIWLAGLALIVIGVVLNDLGESRLEGEPLQESAGA